MSSQKLTDEVLRILSLVHAEPQRAIVKYTYQQILDEFVETIEAPPDQTTVACRDEEEILVSLRYIVTVRPTSGLWENGKFCFQVSIPKYYKPGVSVKLKFSSISTSPAKCMCRIVTLRSLLV